MWHKEITGEKVGEVEDSHSKRKKLAKIKGIQALCKSKTKEVSNSILRLQNHLFGFHVSHSDHMYKRVVGRPVPVALQEHSCISVASVSYLLII